MARPWADSTPPQPLDLDERLRAAEPPITPEDTPVRRPLETRVGTVPGDLQESAGAEPRSSWGRAVKRDSQAAFEAWLAANEPSTHSDDTHPARWRATPARAGWVLRALALALILGAVVLIGAALAIWQGVGETDASETPVDGIAQGIPDRPETVRQPAQATATPLPPLPPTQPLPPSLGAEFALPTAAADEIAAALMTPAGIVPADGIVTRNSAPFTIRPGAGRSRVELYTVQQGDTLESIAERFGLQDFYTLIWSNRSSRYNPLRPGVQLNILPEDGVYHEVTENLTIAALAERYGVDPYAVIDAEYNNLFGSSPDTLLVTGMWIVVPGGEAERALFLQAPVSSGTGSSGGADYVSGTYTLWGCTAEVGGGTLPYGRPLANYTWMRGFAPGGHTGVDIAARSGDPVYASGGGTVVYAGSVTGGYGNVVVLAHGPVFTLYAHLTSANARCGQQVGAGAVIGTVGSTGNSTGPHLHFEVRDANFNALNPQNWVSF